VKRCVRAGLLCALLPALTGADVNHPVSITLAVTAAVQGNAPLRVTEVLPGSGTAAASLKIRLKNYSSKAISRFALSGILSRPEGCVTKADLGQESDMAQTGVGSIHADYIAPGSEIEIMPNDFHPANLVFNAVQWRATYMNVQAGIDFVEFSDGSRWDHHRKLGKPFEPNLLKLDRKECKQPPDPAASLAEFDHIRYVQMNSEEGARLPVQYLDSRGMKFTCVVQGAEATCPIF
jgi:hypothetical protein